MALLKVQAIVDIIPYLQALKAKRFLWSHLSTLQPEEFSDVHQFYRQFFFIQVSAKF